MYIKKAIGLLRLRLEEIELTDEEADALTVLQVWHDLGCPIELSRRTKRDDQAGEFFK